MILTGGSLGERQKELNDKVNEAATKNINFDEVKATVETSDVDKLYKIDLASKLKHVDYIIEVLKSGDSLHITRALKCIWLYEDQYSHIINRDYLHQHIFPLMSIKMKKKMLNAVSVHVTDESRAAEFYEYCLETSLQHIATKFLFKTSEPFRYNYIQDKIVSLQIEYLEHLIKNSFVLAEAYLIKLPSWQRYRYLHELRYLYSVSDENYLKLLEKYVGIDYIENVKRFGLRISKDIIQKHKLRIIQNPCLYLNTLNKSVIVRHSTDEDAKIYISAVFPNRCETFWSNNFCDRNDYLINLISPNKRFEFLKTTFGEKYAGEPFEMSETFYGLEYYKYMTVSEREAWALRHIESKKELLGNRRDFLWYKFVNYDIAISAIKKYILITPDATKRAEIIRVLIDSTRHQGHLQKLFEYYYERHINEDSYCRERFIDACLEKYNVFELNEDCWAALNKLFYKNEVYNIENQDYKNQYVYRVIAIMHYIIHGNMIPEVLQKYFDRDHVPFSRFKSYLDKISKEKQNLVYDYLLRLFVNKIEIHDNQPYNDDVQRTLRDEISNVLELMSWFEKPETERPPIVTKFIKLDPNFSPHSKEPTISLDDLLRHLKQNSSLVVNDIPIVKKKLAGYNYYEFKLTVFWRKLKIYFTHDIAKDYLQLCEHILDDKETWRYYRTNIVVQGILQLADAEYKSEFMKKHAPSEAKIAHDVIDRNLLEIQEAICRFAFYSRPPVPLSDILLYITGDYVHYCLPMFNNYSSNLPLPLALQFTESLLDAPVSIQKHALRLVFQICDSAKLKVVLLDKWKKTKNISLRMIIYTSLFERLKTENKTTQKEWFDILQTFTLTIRDDDHDSVFNILLSRFDTLPDIFIGEYLETIWKTVSKFSSSSNNIEHMSKTINNIKDNIHAMKREFVQSIVNDHVQEMFAELKIVPTREKPDSILDQSKWGLVESFIVYYDDNVNDLQSGTELAKHIVMQCVGMWNEIHFDYDRKHNSFFFRVFCFNFLDQLLKEHFNINKDCYSRINPLFENLLEILKSKLPLHEIYGVVWALHLAVITNNILNKENLSLKNESYFQDKIENLCFQYAKALGDITKEFVEKKIYYKTYFEKILQIVRDNIDHMCQRLFTDSEFMCISIGIGLLDVGTLEADMLAVGLLPSKCSENSSHEYKTLINRFKLLNNDEAKYLYFLKLQQSGFNVSMA